MLKIKDDVPLINLIDIGFTCKPFNIFSSLLKPGEHRERYFRTYNDVEVTILSDDREIKCLYTKGLSKFWTPNMYDHCIRDLVQKGYVEDAKD